MGLRTEYSLGHSEFNEFLFAYVSEDNGGLQLTVLSALARLGLDPWGEAAILAKLPKDAATRALSTMLSALPDEDWQVSDARSIAGRLVNCLPSTGSRSSGTPHGSGIGDRQPTKSELRKWLPWFALVATVLIAVWLLHDG